MGTRAVCISLTITLLSGAIANGQAVPDEQSPDRAATDASIEFFENQIAPLLKRRCYGCHSHEAGKAKGGLVLDSRHGWEHGGSEGPAIVPGKPDESILMRAVRYETYEMPPDAQLPADEIALLRKWIELGAPDPRSSRTSTVDSAKLWALQPIKDALPPTVDDTTWIRDELDAFILAGLEAKGLRPSGDADRYTLLRRVSFDLTGLPPSPADIESFVSDTSAQAYEKVVDRLLESPAFGDHWARHWFDLSCYADLADIQGDTLIRDAWRYRDYVIDAFNADKPLDRFIHEQIAGDLLPHQNVQQRREHLIATGFLAIGPWTLQNYIKKQLDADVVDHQIDKIGRTFLAQTISCARCHDHKFDPIPTADYYSLAGIFHSTLTTSYDGPGVWSAINTVRLPNVREEAEAQTGRRQIIAKLKAQQQTLQAELTALLPSIPSASDANVLTLKVPIDANASGKRYQLRFKAGPSVWAAASQKTQETDGLQLDLLREDGSVHSSYRHRPGAWSGTQDAQQLVAAAYEYQGDGTGKLRIRVTSATPGTARFGGAIDDVAIAEGERTLFVEDFNGLRHRPIRGSQADTGLAVFAQAVVPGWLGEGLNHSHAVDLGNNDYAIQFFGGRSSISRAKPVTAAQKQAYEKAIALKRQLDRLREQIAHHAKQFEPERALSVRDTVKPADSPIYRRGDFQNLGMTVPRGFLTAVAASHDYPVPSGTSGRLQLARWLTDRQHPLTSRVLVNRIWHHIFGNGLVRTVDYFGVHGELPSHPELLDFLALRMRDADNWSAKQTVRRMVLSRTYQMASTHRADAARIDPNNRLLWQMPRRRLTAESIRDAMLMASGRLDAGRGGPSLGLEMDGNIRGAGGNVNPPTWGKKIPDNVKNRRTVYLPLQRQRPQGELEILSVFDFPHPNDITGVRPQTTVATQALFLLNAPFVKQQANALADRLAAMAPKNERARINQLYLLTFSRPPADEEIETAIEFLKQCSGDQSIKANAWTQLCHAFFSSNGFLFRE